MDIKTGTNQHGLRWARTREWRVIAYAEGGYCVHHYIRGPGWCIDGEENCPPEVERELCAALGIACDHPEPRRYDVNASCLSIKGDAGDGAYDLHMRGATAAQIAQRLQEVLTSDWGLSEADGPCMLSIHIGPAGTSDDMPI